jgi:thiol-disulfide isomerase/thioredoxin
MNNESKLYYFYTIGCAFCKKTDSIVEELNKEDHNILRLDLAEKENKEIAEDLKKKYNIRCGTPLFVNAETGHHICGYREKDIVLKWIAGEDIPPPPKPTRPAPRVPFHDARPNETNNWKVDYDDWADENSHLSNLKTADELLAMPRPKSLPPPMPRPGSSDTEIKKWRTGYKKWAKENKHLPNLIPGEQLEQRIRSAQQQQPPQTTAPVDQRLKNLEDKLDKLMNHLGVK